MEGKLSKESFPSTSKDYQKTGKVGGNSVTAQTGLYCWSTANYSSLSYSIFLYSFS